MSFSDLFKKVKTIAIVGLSNDPDRYSYQVANYLIKQGFKIFPVNPNVATVFGLKSFKNLKDIKEKIDAVDIFRRSEFVGPIVDDAIKVGVKIIWMQEGVQDEVAAAKARAAGLQVIMNVCMMKSHNKVISNS